MVARPWALALLLGCRGIPTRDDLSDGAAPPCEVGASCDGACRDLARDPAHCGACGRRCDADALCDEGVCAPRVAQVSAGADHTCALTTRGEVWCWGRNELGQAGGDEAVGVFRPTRVGDLPAVRAVSSGDGFSCVISESEGEVWCWGGNANGTCDVGSSEPTCRRPVRLPGVRGAGAICTGGFASCVTVEGGAVRCWGSNDWGGLGDGRVGRAQPSTVDLDAVTHLGCGWGHVCARRDDGAVWCWGARNNGQVGDGRPGPLTAVSVRPTLVRDLEDAAGVASSGETSCAWNAAGAVRCWGGNDEGAIGDGSVSVRWFPETVTLAGGVEALWSGRLNFFARTADGALLGWGSDRAGNLGQEPSQNLTRPTPVFPAVAPRVREVTAGVGHTCVRLDDGAVRCLGDGRYGQLGDGRSGVRSAAPTRPRWGG